MRDNLAIYAALYGVPEADIDERVAELLDTFGLSDRVHERAGTLSRGMKQRLALARAFVHRPEIVFLDEPTAGLDPVLARSVHELIVRVSSRVRTFQEAYQLGALVVLPVWLWWWGRRSA